MGYKNENYRKGYLKENKIVNDEKALGRVAFRSAGSHSPIDVVSIDPYTGIIRLIQAKTYELSELQKKRIFEEVRALQGVFEVKFLII